MNVHVYGNRPSLAKAIYGLRRTAQEGEQKCGSEAREFMERNFYIDNWLKSLPTEEASGLLKRTQEKFAILRFQKTVSNIDKSMKAFLLVAMLLVTRARNGSFPLHNIALDCFGMSNNTYSHCKYKLVTRQDFKAPFTVQGKILLRQLTSENTDWDNPLPRENKT